MTYNFYPTDELQGIKFTQVAQSTGVPRCFTIANGVNTAITASTEASLVDWNLTSISESI